MPGVRPVGLGALLVAAQRRWSPPARRDAPGTDRARAPRPRTASPSSPPTRPPDRSPAKRSRNRAHRRDAPVRSARGHLAGHRVDPLGRDLRPMLIHPHHQRHPATSVQPARPVPHEPMPLDTRPSMWATRRSRSSLIPDDGNATKTIAGLGTARLECLADIAQAHDPAQAVAPAPAPSAQPRSRSIPATRRDQRRQRVVR